MKKYAKHSSRPILRRLESMMAGCLSRPEDAKSMLARTIQLTVIERVLKRMEPEKITDLTTEPAHIRYDFLTRVTPSHTRHRIVVSIKGKDYLACLSVSKYKKEKPTLELIDLLPASSIMTTKINYENNRIWLD